MKLFYNSDGTVKVLPVSALPANAVWNGGFPYTPEGSLLVSIVSAKPTDTVSNGGFIQELWGGVCAGYDTPSIWIGGLAITSYGALCLDVDGGIVTDGPVIYNSLTNSLIPTRGSLTPSFTRATTATGQKWDEAGYLDFTALAGEVVFKGARRVRNLLTFTEDFSNAAWVKPTGCTIGSNVVANPINGALTADKIIPPVSASFHSVYQSYSLSGATHNYSIYLKNAGYNFAYISPDGGTSGVTINLTTGATTTTGSVTAAATSVGNGWWRVSCLSSVTTNTIRVYPGSTTAPESLTGDGTSGIYAWGAQLEDVTGQTTQTASEYVSVGVESAPAYHGSMVDGVKCYDTDRSGNPISTSGSYPIVGYVPWEARTNLCLQSNAYNTAPWSNAFGTVAFTQNATGPDGATSAWTGVDSDGAVASYGAQSMTLTAANWTQRILVKKTTGAQATYPCFGAYRGSTDIAMCTIDTSNGIATVWTAYTGLTVSTSSARCKSYNALFWEVELTLLGTAAVWTQCLMKFPAGTSNPTQSTGVIDGTLQGSAVFYGGTMELGSFATSYIPTTTVAVTRNADVLTYTGADVANIKTLACTFSRGVGVNSNGYAVALSDGTTNNYISMSTPSATQARFLGVTGGVTQWDTIPAYTAGVTSKVSQSFATNDIKMDKDGTAQTADTAATVPVVTQLNVGHIATLLVLNGPVNHIYGWTRNLSQSELGAIDA